MTRRTSLALLLFLVLATIAGLALWQSDAAPVPAIAAGAGPAAGERAEPTAAPELASRVESRAPAAGAPEPRAAGAVEPVPPPVAPEAEEPDLEAQLPLDLVVVDEQAQPVFDAAIRIEGLRSESSPGSWFQFRGTPAVARTDPNGRARIDYWKWVDVDGRTVSVDLGVTHPEFVPFRDDSFAVGPGERRVVLARGAVVSVRAWHGTPSRVVTDIEIQLEREAALGPKA